MDDEDLKIIPYDVEIWGSLGAAKTGNWFNKSL